MSVTVVLRTADGAFFRREVKAAAYTAVGYKFTVLAVGAYVMRLQRVYFGNAGHICHKRRAY